MFNGLKLLAVVPARGGSKGVPLKNIQSVAGVPLVALTGKIIRDIKIIDRAIVSTDNDKIKKVAVESGLDVPFMRPGSLSGDRVADWDVLVHCLQRIEQLDSCKYNVIVMLPPTSPLRKKEHVIKSIEKLVNGKYDAVWTVSEVDTKYHPLKQLVLKKGQLDYYDDNGNKIIARQQLSNLYQRNGAAYVMTRECILENKDIKGKKTGAYVIEEPMISIDTWDDFKLVEYYLQKKMFAARTRSLEA
jgi:CMP-N-acetylneuraminic acid synthetase